MIIDFPIQCKPIREAHTLVGSLVRSALAGDGSFDDLVASDHRLGPEAAALLESGMPMRRRSTPGGAGPEPVVVQRARFADQLNSQRARLGV